MQGDIGLSKSQKKRMKKKASAAAKENETDEPTEAGRLLSRSMEGNSIVVYTETFQLSERFQGICGYKSGGNSCGCTVTLLE